MKFYFIRFILLTILLGAFFVLALPSGEIRFGDKTIYLPEVNFSKLGINATLGNMQKSYGLFDSTQYKFEIEFGGNIEKAEDKENILKSTRQRINERIYSAGLYDLETNSEIKNGKYYIAITFPENYINKEEYAKLLTVKGNVGNINLTRLDRKTFQVTDSSEIEIKNLKSISRSNNSSVKLSNGSVYNQNIPNLLLGFDSSVSTQIVSLRNTTVAELEQGENASTLTNVTLSIDGVVNYSLTSHLNDDTLLHAIPSINSELPINTKFLNDYLNLTATIFDEPKSLEFNLKQEKDTKNISATYRNEGYKFLIATFIAGLIILLFISLRKIKNKRKALAYIYLISLTTLALILALKITQANLSIGSILGISISLLVNFLLLLRFIKVSKQANQIAITQILNFAILFFFIFALILKLNINLGIMNDTVGVLITNSIVLVVLSLTGFLSTKEIFRNLSINLRFRRK